MKEFFDATHNKHMTAGLGIQGGFGKLLASTEKEERDRAVKAIGSWLRKRNDISDQELAKLWKGIFYCAISPRHLSNKHTSLLCISTVVESSRLLALGQTKSAAAARRQAGQDERFVAAPAGAQVFESVLANDDPRVAWNRQVEVGAGFGLEIDVIESSKRDLPFDSVQPGWTSTISC